jgi:cell division septation protein DedD
MAEKKGNEWWLIVLVVVVAIGAFFILSNSKMQPTEIPSSTPDILAETPKPVVNVVSSSDVKTDHAAADQSEASSVKPVASVVSPIQTLPSKESFAVQVNSFKDKARADVQLEKIKAKGLKAYIMASDLGARGVFYRVRAGSFATEVEAKEALEVILTNFKSGIIVTE